MLQGKCVCGAAGWVFEGEPDGATICNCTACRRYGVLWIYGWLDESVRINGSTASFARGTELTFEFCATCAAVVCWRGCDIHPGGRRRMAVNARLAEPESVGDLAVTQFDGLHTFTALKADGRKVRDLWF